MTPSPELLWALLLCAVAALAARWASGRRWPSPVRRCLFCHDLYATVQPRGFLLPMLPVHGNGGPRCPGSLTRGEAA